MTLQKFVVLAPIFMLLGALSGCNDGIAKSQAADSLQSSAPLPVQVVTPEVAELFAKYHTTATVTSDADAPVTARVGGEIVEILVEEGDWVEKGTLLARLDGDRLRIQMVKASALLSKTIREHDRFVNLHARGLVSTAALDDMKYDMDALRASYELAQLNYEYASIRASISGFVSARYVKIGQHIITGNPTFRITDASELIATLQIPQNELASFSTGLDISVKVDSMPEQQFAASIARVSPTIDARSGTFRATAKIDNSDGLLAAGMFGRFEVAYEKHADALVIPAAALLDVDDVSVVYVVVNGAAVQRKVTTGIEDNGKIEILRGLDGSEEIIVNGQNGLRQGSKVIASGPLPAPATG